MRSNIIRLQLLYSNLMHQRTNSISNNKCKLRYNKIEFPIRTKRSFTMIRKNNTKYVNKILEINRTNSNNSFQSLIPINNEEPQDYPLPRGNKIFGLLERKFLSRVLTQKRYPAQKQMNKNIHMTDFGCNCTVDLPPIDDYKRKMLGSQTRSNSIDSKNFKSTRTTLSKNMRIIIRIPITSNNI